MKEYKIWTVPPKPKTWGAYSGYEYPVPLDDGEIEERLDDWSMQGWDVSEVLMWTGDRKVFLLEHNLEEEK